LGLTEPELTPPDFAAADAVEFAEFADEEVCAPKAELLAELSLSPQAVKDSTIHATSKNTAVFFILSLLLYFIWFSLFVDIILFGTVSSIFGVCLPVKYVAPMILIISLICPFYWTIAVV
jgi:hypothetical protein